MPIKGVTDIVRMPRLGKIHLGVKVEGDRSTYPRAVDYFVCPPEVVAIHGEKPKELDVMFPNEDDERWGIAVLPPLLASARPRNAAAAWLCEKCGTYYYDTEIKEESEAG